MKLSTQIEARDADHPFFTFEFFPPRTDQGFENLMSRISRLSALNPIAISVTWGAGGSTKDRSLELASLTQQSGLDTILHLTCTNMERGLIDEVLKTAKEQGIQNILALRGDPPRGKEEWIPADPRFTRAIDLVSYIRSVPEYSDWFCVGVAGYPDGHPDTTTDEDTEISRLKQKVDAGADFIVTQLFYDADYFISWYKKVREQGSPFDSVKPFFLIPLRRYNGTRNSWSHADTNIFLHDDSLVKDYGVKLAVAVIQEVQSGTGINGFHFCTLNLEKSVQRVLQTLGWAGSSSTAPNKLIADSVPGDLASSSTPVQGDLVISPQSATDSATLGLSSILTTTVEAGSGELNKAATWDDFPNGRFGDFKSPAYGDQDQWGGSNFSKNEALIESGKPKTVEDLTNIFLDHLHSKLSSTPFSSGPLSAESLTILPHLERLNKRGWWTVGSQPAVNGASSSDEVVGWGPRSGYVFQKCFVEFFCGEKDVEVIEKKIIESGNGWVHYFAGNYKGECRTNVPEGGRNAVTWGVFPGQEIVQTTIIERESFLHWKDEAFSIWSEWASYYRPDSDERKLLEDVRDNRWLVSIVHHDYLDPEALWTFLLDQ
ncbi:hypothetical protein D9613_002717 [Agrocybe pediades]|uniref:MTHFR SAM-binding regulatory domain-containing protein n=1 Tax=Agrocybe pediades TaxID=84607 RepID=A0A8H4QR77_9AGAR|nr:hypothetical protein D9613_002717 [Agrocybe pediades]